ncbi:MAG: orotidine-5'-phosphate decarboxylase [Bacteroidales bacterium]|nr:orotidine-5'-phosphate decarboxylase [Bacteroidales bacterium]
MNTDTLYSIIRRKKSFLCVGLDSDIKKIPQHLLSVERPVYEFNKQIIDATAPYCIACKPNLAFYESRGLEGWRDFELTTNYIKQNYPDIFLIADAKRGDIGNTSKMYASAFFENLNYDAVTVAPYMGEDSVKPFLEFKNKFVILLALTSNPSAENFQYFTSKLNKPLFIDVIEKSLNWGNSENMMYVIGATKVSMLVKIRELIPDHFLLVPGVGAQGGSLKDIAEYGLNNKCGLIVNASRSIIFSDSTNDFANAAAKAAKDLQSDMEKILAAFELI